MTSQPIVVSFGGGADSTAMLIEMRRRDVRPSLILFADTGNRDAELPETYEHVDRMSAWCRQHFGVGVTTVRNDGAHPHLEASCLAKQMLPSIVYGFKSCSEKYKIRPMDKFVKRYMTATGNDSRIMRAIGYNADESHRGANIESDKHFDYWYPLVEWAIGRAEAKAICEAELDYVPMKSSCFFCPSTKKGEVRELARRYPDLFARAVAMERNAAPNLITIKGLGRGWSWEALAAADEAQMDLFADPPAMPCVCADGDDDE